MNASIEAKLDERLHERLAQARGQLTDDATLPIVIKCERDAVERIAARVTEIGGTVRHQMRLIGAVAAWLPLRAIEVLGAMPEVRALEMEELYRIAR